jgi:hypothetical protein
MSPILVFPTKFKGIRRMTPCMNAFMTLTRVLSIAGFAFVLVGFWQRHRLEKYLLSRASKRCPNP